MAGVNCKSAILGLHSDTAATVRTQLDPGVADTCVCLRGGGRWRGAEEKAHPHILKDQACWLLTAGHQA